MLDDVLEEIQKKMLEAEGELFDELPNYSLDELLDLYSQANNKVLDNAESVEIILKGSRKFGQEAIFSTLRVLKAILAEIEYRIKENKI